jgi:hypothetical protein
MRGWGRGDKVEKKTGGGVAILKNTHAMEHFVKEEKKKFLETFK